MTDTQLHLAIGVPVISNVLLVTVLLAYINTRFSSLDKRLADLRDLWRAELRRVEDILDARLKHIEEERRS